MGASKIDAKPETYTRPKNKPLRILKAYLD